MIEEPLRGNTEELYVLVRAGKGIIQHFLFAAWENEERGSSGKGVFLDSDCLKGNERRCIPSNQLATFLFLFYIQEANIYFFSAISIR